MFSSNGAVYRPAQPPATQRPDKVKIDRLRCRFIAVAGTRGPLTFGADTTAVVVSVFKHFLQHRIGEFCLENVGEVLVSHEHRHQVHSVGFYFEAVVLQETHGRIHQTGFRFSANFFT